jgi:rhomboid protease GluP
MARTGSILCPSCGQLVGVNDEQCLNCGRRRPGLFGFTTALRGLGPDYGFGGFVLWLCGALYLATLASHVSGMQMGGLSLVAPSTESLFLFGASGAVPVFTFGRWWTILSAGWLHAGVLHLVFNMMWIRDLARPNVELYGPARTVIVYVVSGAVGFLASSLAGSYLVFLPGPLRGAGFTVGASAPLFGLLGALLQYGHRTGSSMTTERAKGLALSLLLFGFIMPGIDNWAHLGGLAGGYLVSRWLDPLRPERGDHAVIGLLLLAASLAAVVYSVASGLRFFQPA